MRHDDILQTVGRTPAVRLACLEPAGVEVWAKLEAFNPLGSVKDRMALGVIEDAEARGRLRPGQTVVEATSGNSGIGLAMVCARKGYPLVIVMAENFSVERRRLMRFLGARVVLTPAALKGTGMLVKARELADAHGWFWPRQFDNEANAHIHERTTAHEILSDFAAAPLTHWVTGSGTGGTLLGVGRELRRHSPQTEIVLCEPDNAPLVAGRGPGEAQQPAVDGVAESHPRFRPHPVQGWTPDFVPGLVQQALDEGLVDRLWPIDGEAALRTARELARREGILAGISGGATVAGALALAATLPAGSRVLAMVPDTGERYLSTPLFADIPEAMDDQEWAISRSTPQARFDAPVAAPAPSSAPAPAPSTAPVATSTPGAPSVRDDRAAPPEAPAAAGEPEPPARGAAPDGDPPATEEPTGLEPAIAFVDAQLGDRTRPVVMFGLRWCEFCWTVRRFFGAIGATLHPVDLDVPALQADDFSTRVRGALADRTGATTLPQIFIGGRWIGGCMDTLVAWEQGRLQPLLAAAGVAFDEAAAVEPLRLLPGWVQPR